MKVNDILNNIDTGALALPVFQRGYVWKRRQVKDLITSLYNEYPVGSLLIWTTSADSAKVRGGKAPATGAVHMLLDGQQRVTSLYGLMRGAPPPFFEGDARPFSGLYFNLDSESFEFVSASVAKSDPHWIHVTEFFSNSDNWIARLAENPAVARNLTQYLQRGLRVANIRDISIPAQDITGEDKTIEVVVDIFNRVNSGGTRLSKGDLALATIGSQWPSVRKEMRQRVEKWEAADFKVNLDWLLRCMNAIVTNTSEFEKLDVNQIGIEPLRRALLEAESAVDYLLESMRSHLYTDINRVYMSKASLVTVVKYLVNSGGRVKDRATLARLFHWYLNCGIWGRYTGATETVMGDDLAVLTEKDAISGLLRNLRMNHGGRSIEGEDFNLQYVNARFYPLLYIMSRMQDARDWHTGNRLRHHSLGDDTNLEMHHIFPRALLQKNGIRSKDINNMGNIAFQTRETNRAIGKTAPAEYMPKVFDRWPGALESQWIPTEDSGLWEVRSYFAFLRKRRALLAKAANDMLAALAAGVMQPAEEVTQSIAEGRARITVGQVVSAVVPEDPDDLDAVLAVAEAFAANNGLPSGERAYELHDEDGQQEVVALDLAWPDGLQVGYSQPVALMVHEDAATRLAASEGGFKVFTSLYDFQRHVRSTILTVVENGD